MPDHPTTRLLTAAAVTTAIVGLALALAIVQALPAVGAPADRGVVIPLPDAMGAEGIATGAGSTFYAGDRVDGDLYRGDLRTGEVEQFVDAPDGRVAIGLATDLPSGLLFVAGGGGGEVYVHDLTTGEEVAVVPAFGEGFINDVVVADGAAWVTNSGAAVLTRIPIVDGVPGEPEALPLSGPAADTSSGFNNNGIAATPDGSALLVAHSGQGAINVVDPVTGESTAVEGVDVPNADGILLEAGRLFVVQNQLDQVAVVDLEPDLRSGVVTDVLTDDAYATPTTVARWGNQLATVNARFAAEPGTVDYEVVTVRR